MFFFLFFFCLFFFFFVFFVVVCIQAAEPDDPQDAVVARQYKEFPDVYKQTASHWSQVYAGGNSSVVWESCWLKTFTSEAVVLFVCSS